MSDHVTISPSEAADRLAIRELIEAYAHCADRRDAKRQMSLFTPDTHFLVYMNAKNPTPSQELRTREALAPVFADLNKYDATTHFIGQTTILTLAESRATGETYCLAHHVTVADGKRRLMVASLRYLDTFVKTDISWLFAERKLYVDWIDERALSWRGSYDCHLHRGMFAGTAAGRGFATKSVGDHAEGATGSNRHGTARARHRLPGRGCPATS
jgi:hypothetical protein